MKLRNFHWPPLALRIKMLTVAQAALTPVPGPAPAPRLHPSLPCPCRSGLELPSHTRLLTQGWHTYCSLSGNAMPILWGLADTLSCSGLCCTSPEKPPHRPRPGCPRVIFLFAFHTVSFLVSCLSLPPARLWVPRAWCRVPAINSPRMISRKYK